MGGMQNYVSHSWWILPDCVYLQNIKISYLHIDFWPRKISNFGWVSWKLDNPYYHISIPLMFHDLMIICGIFVPLLATKPIITSRVMPGLVSSKVQGIIPITYLALRAICCRVHYCIMHKDKVKRTNRLNLMVQAKSNQGSGLQSAICQWFFCWFGGAVLITLQLHWLSPPGTFHILIGKFPFFIYYQILL